MQMGWPQQIWYTWNTQKTRWVMPAQYYSRRMWFDDISVDIFYLDSNIGDGHTTDAEHDICTKDSNAGPVANTTNHYCAGFIGDGLGSCPGTNFTGDTTGRSPIGSGFDAMKNCHDIFQDLWDEQLAWLDRELAASDADWQFLVTHFPPNYEMMNNDLKPIAQKHGVDFVMTGHSHLQKVRYKEPEGTTDWGDIAWVVSGGGGGITSEGAPTVDHSHDDDQHHGTITGEDDQYGFMDITVRRDTFTITAYSFLPTLSHEPIVRSTTEVTKNEPSTVEFTSMVV